MRHKAGAHKSSPDNYLSYSPVIQIKLFIFRQRNDRKIQQF